MNADELYKKPIERNSRRFYIFTALSILTPIATYFIPLRPPDESLASWFQRSGAVMVVFALVAESNAISIFNILNPSGFVSEGFDEAEKQFKNRPVNFSKISFFIIAIGTLIWGYGDLLVK